MVISTFNLLSLALILINLKYMLVAKIVIKIFHLLILNNFLKKYFDFSHFEVLKLTAKVGIMILISLLPVFILDYNFIFESLLYVVIYSVLLFFNKEDVQNLKKIIKKNEL